LLVIFCVGTLVSVVLKKDARILHWVNTAHQVQSAYPLDINNTTVQDLDKLPGIGLKTAQRIIDYRQSSGKFRSIEEVRKVKGISKKALETIARYCRFAPL
jgi:competence ComEA-like helix-hairpin-helix protein